jgi:hypothetical protein
MSLLTFENPVFRYFAVAGALMILKPTSTFSPRSYFRGLLLTPGFLTLYSSSKLD